MLRLHSGSSLSRVLLWSTYLVTACVGLPILAIAVHLFIPAGDIWNHLFPDVLSGYLLDSLKLSIGTAIGTLLIGISTAWLCSSYRFPGRNLFRWALVLPLAYPAYITAYTYTGILDYGGTLYTFGREHFNVTTPLPVRSMSGAVAISTFTLYPYVYLLIYSSWLQRTGRLLEAGRILGAKPWENLTKVALPTNRPAIIAGATIVIMETLADYGMVQHLGINTLSIGIMKTWFGLNSIAGAAQLSTILLVLTVSLMIIERKARRRARYDEPAGPIRSPLVKLQPRKAFAASVVCAVPVLLGFVIPTVQLAALTLEQLDKVTGYDYLALAGNTLTVAALSAVLIVTISLLLSYSKRFHPTAGLQFILRTVSSGYAVPGVVIAVGVLGVGILVREATGLLIAGGFSMLMLAYVVRFLTLGFSTTEAALEKVSSGLDFSARTLNTSMAGTLLRVHLPLISPGVFAALLLVFVDVIKELPATLVLRPFNYNTLAVRTYELASDERLAEAALPALSIVVIALLPLIILVRSMGDKDR